MRCLSPGDRETGEGDTLEVTASSVTCAREGGGGPVTSCVRQASLPLRDGSHFTRHRQAVRTQAPPAALIFFSASFVKYRAFTITGMVGSCPFPRTLKNPAFPTSITGAFEVFLA